MRFLPEYDNVLLGHADRTRIAPPGVSRWTEVGWGAVLVDGVVAARWKMDREKEAAVLRIEPFRRIPRADRTAVEDEGIRLLDFLADGVGQHQVRLI